MRPIGRGTGSYAAGWADTPPFPFWKDKRETGAVSLLDQPLREKIAAIVTKVYGGAGVAYTAAASKELDWLEAMGYGGLPVCMAKTQYSLSDDAAKLGRPEGFTVTVRNVKVSAGAGFVVALTGDIMTMPGLPKVPAAESIDVDENGRITGLF